MDPIGPCRIYDCVEGTRREREYARDFKEGAGRRQQART